MNTRKEIIIGFVVGIIANTFGTLLYILLFSDLSIVDTFNAAVEQGVITSYSIHYTKLYETAAWQARCLSPQDLAVCQVRRQKPP